MGYGDVRKIEQLFQGLTRTACGAIGTRRGGAKTYRPQKSLAKGFSPPIFPEREEVFGEQSLKISEKKERARVCVCPKGISGKTALGCRFSSPFIQSNTSCALCRPRGELFFRKAWGLIYRCYGSRIPSSVTSNTSSHRLVLNQVLRGRFFPRNNDHCR